MYGNTILKVNGYDKVTSVSYAEWASMYRSLKHANIDTSYISNFKALTTINNLYYESGNVHPIVVFDFNFNRITEEAISNEELIEGDNYLETTNSTSVASFETYRAVSSSVLSHSIYGNKVYFMLTKNMFFTNNENQEIVKIEIDLGNGENYRTVNFDEIITANYQNENKHIEIKLRLTFENIINQEQEVLYTHSSFFHKKGETNEYSQSELKAKGLNPQGTSYYPTGEYISKSITIKTGKEDPTTTIFDGIGEYDFEYLIYYHLGYTGTKLKKPIIVVDGFDPGNKRGIFRNEVSDNALPYDKDERGIYDIMNGYPSPWYEGDNNPKLVKNLNALGYDVIIVNIDKGGGMIQNNAETFRSFLNEVVNGASLRDNQTEENIVVGPSMGGLITRYAITTMEAADEEHFIKMWFSFDSPHKGANVSISLQHAVAFGEKFNFNSSFDDALEKLNSDAAKQMLLYHHTETNLEAEEDEPSTHTELFGNLYNELRNLDYPVKPLRISISNGGKSKLYPDLVQNDENKIIDFRAKWSTWSQLYGYPTRNTDGGFLIFDGSRQGYGNDEEIRTNEHIGYDNATGSWISGVYTINFDKSNTHSDDLDTTRASCHTASTFMPVASTFGLAVTRGNVYNSWKDYDVADTPFDKITGAEENEQHMRISHNTANYIIDELANDHVVVQRPRTGLGRSITEDVTGKVAYRGDEIILGGGNNSTITIHNGADVTAVASSSVHLTSGFHASSSNGAKFHATTGSQKDAVVKSEPKSTKKIDYGYSKSPYLGIVYDYSTEEQELRNLTFSSFSVYPNPSQSTTTISFTLNQASSVSIQITDLQGKEIKSLEQNKNYDKGKHSNAFDISDLTQGIYMITIKTNNFIKSEKLIVN